MRFTDSTGELNNDTPKNHYRKRTKEAAPDNTLYSSDNTQKKSIFKILFT